MESEILKSILIKKEEINQNTSIPCNKCGCDTQNNLAGYKIWGACTCRQCMFAYFVFLFVHCYRRASYQKKEDKAKIAQYQAKNCQNKYWNTYFKDWREKMLVIMPNFESKLNSSLYDQVQIESLVEEANKKGFL